MDRSMSSTQGRRSDSPRSQWSRKSSIALRSPLALLCGSASSSPTSPWQALICLSSAASFLEQHCGSSLFTLMVRIPGFLCCGPGSIPARGTEITLALQCCLKKKTSLAVRGLRFPAPMQGAWVQSLVGQLRSHMLHSTSKNK